MILILIFAEALGLYGLIIAIILTQWGSKEELALVQAESAKELDILKNK
jgi:hypothetical protein